VLNTAAREIAEREWLDALLCRMFPRRHLFPNSRLLAHAPQEYHKSRTRVSGLGGWVRRREFTSALCAAAALPLCARAQHRSKPFRIGILGYTTAEQHWRLGSYPAFIDEMSRLGYAEGRDVVYEFAWAESRPERLPALAVDLVKRGVNVIVAPASVATAAAQQATQSIPIVMISADVVELGFAASLSRPGGNITGIDVGGSRIAFKILEILKQAVPSLSRMATLGLPNNPHWKLTVAGTGAMATRLGVSIENILIDNVDGLDSGFDQMKEKRIEGAMISAEPTLTPLIPRIAQIALRNRIAAAFFYTLGAEVGGLLAYETEVRALFRRAAVYVDKILKGAKPADLPIEFATRFKFTINLKTARALGLTIPEAILAYADRVIE
jgi:putative ABC transport system substrate-binding protein